MYKMIAYIFVLVIIGTNCVAATSNIPEAVRRSYALKFHEAFILQSAGLSTKAFYLFKDAYQEALRAGEPIQKANLMDELFRWYRTYGSSLHLFGREPTGNDRIVSSPSFGHSSLQSHEFHIQSPLATIPDYSSEWGNTPEQAGHVRIFIFGVAQVISGVFCVTVGGPVAIGTGWGMVTTGVGTMVYSLNSAWVDYERAMLDLKKWEAKAKKTVEDQ